MHRLLPRLLLVLGLVAPITVGASDVGLNPPAAPTPVGGAVLTYTRTVSVPRLTIPGTLTVTETVKNTGALTAVNVRVQQELPPGWQVEGKSTLIVRLGDIEAGEQVVRSSTISVATNAAAGRYPNEALVSADGLSPVQATAMVDLTRAAVLGVSTLAETGTTAWPMLVLGLGFLLTGWLAIRRARLNHSA